MANAQVPHESDPWARAQIVLRGAALAAVCAGAACAPESNAGGQGDATPRSRQAAGPSAADLERAGSQRAEPTPSAPGAVAAETARLPQQPLGADESGGRAALPATGAAGAEPALDAAFAPLRAALARLLQMQEEDRARAAELAREVLGAVAELRSSQASGAHLDTARLESLEARLAALETAAQAAAHDKALILGALELTADKLDQFFARLRATPQTAGPVGEAQQAASAQAPATASLSQPALADRAMRGDPAPVGAPPPGVSWWWGWIGVVGLAALSAFVWAGRRREDRARDLERPAPPFAPPAPLASSALLAPAVAAPGDTTEGPGSGARGRPANDAPPASAVDRSTSAEPGAEEARAPPAAASGASAARSGASIPARDGAAAGGAASLDAQPAAASTDAQPAVASIDAQPAAASSDVQPAVASSDDEESLLGHRGPEAAPIGAPLGAVGGNGSSGAAPPVPPPAAAEAAIADAGGRARPAGSPPGARGEPRGWLSEEAEPARAGVGTGAGGGAGAPPPELVVLRHGHPELLRELVRRWLASETHVLAVPPPAVEVRGEVVHARYHLDPRTATRDRVRLEAELRGLARDTAGARGPRSRRSPHGA